MMIIISLFILFSLPEGDFIVYIYLFILLIVSHWTPSYILIYIIGCVFKLAIHKIINNNVKATNLLIMTYIFVVG